MLILCVTIFLPTTVSTGLQGMPCQLESQVHSTNTLIDEVGLVEMEVGLDQLTWGDADLQRELRRLKDNSLKIPNLKYIFKIALLRVIPTLTHYSDIVSDISSGRICGIYVLTYYLTFFSEILFDILSGILSGIYSDILSGIYYILILPCHEFGLGVLLFAWINANGLNIHQMLVSHVCTQWLPLPLIPQNGQVLNLRVGPEKFSGYWKNRTLAQGLKKDVGGRFRYAVGLQSWAGVLNSFEWDHRGPFVQLRSASNFLSHLVSSCLIFLNHLGWWNLSHTAQLQLLNCSISISMYLNVSPTTSRSQLESAQGHTLRVLPSNRDIFSVQPKVHLLPHWGNPGAVAQPTLRPTLYISILLYQRKPII